MKIIGFAVHKGSVDGPALCAMKKSSLPRKEHGWLAPFGPSHLKARQHLWRSAPPPVSSYVSREINGLEFLHFPCPQVHAQSEESREG